MLKIRNLSNWTGQTVNEISRYSSFRGVNWTRQRGWVRWKWIAAPKIFGGSREPTDRRRAHSHGKYCDFNFAAGNSSAGLLVARCPPRFAVFCHGEKRVPRRGMHRRLNQWVLSRNHDSRHRPWRNESPSKGRLIRKTPALARSCRFTICQLISIDVKVPTRARVIVHFGLYRFVRTYEYLERGY